MKSLFQLSIISVLFTSFVSAQTWSQPVREVEKEARNAVYGICQDVGVPAGAVSTSPRVCRFKSIFDPPAISNYVERVPAGKVLVIEDVHASCLKSNTDNFDSLLFGLNAMRPLPLQLRANFVNGRQKYSANLLTRMYAPANERISAVVHMTSNSNDTTSCSVSFYGHYVDVQ